MRGLGNGYTQVLIDGERPPPGFSIDNLSPELVERIEIIRAATAEYSTQAVAGTVNIVMKKFSVSKREVNAGWYSGTGYTSQNLSFNIADKAGTLAYSLGGYSGLGTFGYDGTGSTVGVDSNGKTILDRTSRSANDGNNRWAGLYSTLAWTLPGGDSFTMNPTINLYRYASKNHSITQYLLGETTIYPISDGHNEGDGWNVGNSANWIIKMKTGAKLDLKVNLNVGGRNNDAYSKSFDFDQTQNS